MRAIINVRQGKQHLKRDRKSAKANSVYVIPNRLDDTYREVRAGEGFARIWSLEYNVRQTEDNTVIIISPLFVFIPPGAVGALYGSGCFQFSSNFSVSCSNICIFYIAPSD